MTRVRSFRFAFSFALILLAVISARAEIAVNITYLDPAGEGFFDNSPRTAVGGNADTTLGAQRRNAFEAAVYHWSKMLNGSITLRVRATWTSQGTETLASASPLGFVSDWNGVPVPGRYYPIALANQLAGLDHDPTTDDIQVMCNPDWDNGVNAGGGDARKWYYGTDGAVPGSDFDFYSTVLHELGHGFGFLSFLNTDGSWVNGMPTIYDDFMVDSAGNWVTSLSKSQRASMVTSENLFSAGSQTTYANYDQWAKLYAPAVFDQGSTLSHLDEATFSSPGHIDECMTPTASFATHNLGPVAIGLFRDMGFNFVDSQKPSIAISLPVNGSTRSSLNAASGTAIDSSSSGEAGSSGLREVRVTLARQSGGNWYNWIADDWGSTTFDAHLNIKTAFASVIPIARGSRPWAVELPTLDNGTYEIQVQAVDQMNLGSDWVKSTFTIDNSDPTITFDPIQSNDVVFNFSQLGGFVSDADSVTYAIYDITDATPRFWNGSAWTTSGEAYLPATISNGRWSPDPAQLPSRAQLQLGSYRLYAKARDVAGNQALTSIDVTRSAADTTLPEVLIVTPQADQVFTNRSLPILSGLSYDPESGVENVSVYLLRFTDDGPLYWDGVSWSSIPTIVPVMIDKVGGSYQSTGTLPSGENLPNGFYQVQVTVQNGENPPAVRGAGVSFTVDYHPVYTWTEGSFTDGVANNHNYDFTNPANWSPYGVPPEEAIVVIQMGQCIGPSNATISVHGLNLGSGATLVAPGLFVKKLNVTSGNMNTEAVHVDGNGGIFNWTGGQIRGTVAILEGAVANISGSGTKTLGSGAVLDNWGTINWSGSGNIYNAAYNLIDRATINNRGGAVFTVANDGSLFSSSYNISTFHNFAGAQFVKTGGSGSTYANGFDFINYGELRSESGSLVFDSTFHTRDGSAFTGNGRVILRSGNFGFTGQVMVNGATLEMTSGGMYATNVVLATVNGASFEWQAGSITGEMELAPNSISHLTSSATKSFGANTVFRNRGTMNWSGGNIYTAIYDPVNHATFHNMAGAVLNITGSAVFDFSYSPSLFINDAGATVSKTGGSSTSFNWLFNNAGVVQCSSATLSFNSGGTQSGSYLADGGAIIRFGGGTHSFADGTIWHGAGTFQVANATASLSGLLQVGSEEASTGLELLSGGSLNGQGALLGRGEMKWTGGSLGGHLDFGTNLTINVSGSGTKSFATGTIINNGGVFNWGGTGNLYAAPYELTDRVVFNNLSNAVFNITSNAVFSISYNSSVFNNHPGGTVAKSAGGGATSFEWMFNSHGTVRCSSGSLAFEAGGDNGGVFVADAGGTIRFGSGTHTLAHNTVLNGAGKIQIASGTVVHQGDVQTGTAEVPATLEITSSGAFAGSGALHGVATVNWLSGSVGPGTLDVPSTITFNLTGSATKTLGAPTIFNNSGNFNLVGSSYIYCAPYAQTNRSVFNNLAGGVFTVARAGDVFYSSYNASLFTNHFGGLIIKGGAGTAYFNSFDISNAGEVRVEEGVARFESALDLQHGSLFSGNGEIKLAGATTLGGTLVSSAAVKLEGGSFTGLTNAPFVPTISGAGTYGWTSGSISGALTIDSGVEFTASGSSVKTLGRQTILNNQGTVTWNGSGNLYVYASGSDDGRAFVRNRNGATWNWNTDADMDYSSVPSVFINEGGATFRKAGSTGLMDCGWDFDNQGTLEISSGNIAFNSGITIAPAAVTRLALGGTTASSGYSQLKRSGSLPVAGSLQLILKDSFIPTNGSTFNLVTYTSRTGEFSPVVLPALAGSRWKLSYESDALVARVVPVTSLHGAAKLVNGEFQLTVTGEAGSSVVVEGSTDLVTWHAISTNSPFTGSLVITDPMAANFTNRFYRVQIAE